MTEKPSYKQISLLKKLGINDVPETKYDASKLIEKNLGGSTQEPKKSYSNVTRIVPPNVSIETGSYNEYIQKFVTGQKIVRDIFPDVQEGTTEYFIKLFAIIHDL